MEFYDFPYTVLGIMVPTDFHIFQRGWNHQPADIQLCFFDVYLGWFNELWYVLILLGWSHFLTQIEMLLKGQSISLPRVMTSSTCRGTMCPFFVDSSDFGNHKINQLWFNQRGRGIVFVSCSDRLFGPKIGYGSIPINTIFSGMNIHLPAILGFTRYQGFDPSPIGGSFGDWKLRKARTGTPQMLRKSIRSGFPKTPWISTRWFIRRERLPNYGYPVHSLSGEEGKSFPWLYMTIKFHHFDSSMAFFGGIDHVRTHPGVAKLILEQSIKHDQKYQTDWKM